MNDVQPVPVPAELETVLSQKSCASVKNEPAMLEPLPVAPPKLKLWLSWPMADAVSASSVIMVSRTTVMPAIIPSTTTEATKINSADMMNPASSIHSVRIFCMKTFL